MSCKWTGIDSILLLYVTTFTKDWNYESSLIDAKEEQTEKTSHRPPLFIGLPPTLLNISNGMNGTGKSRLLFIPTAQRTDGKEARRRCRTSRYCRRYAAHRNAFIRSAPGHLHIFRRFFIGKENLFQVAAVLGIWQPVTDGIRL